MYNCLSRLGKNKEWRFLKRLPFLLFLLFWFDAWYQSQYQCFIVTQSKFWCGLHFFPLYLFGYHLKFLLLVKWESTGWGGRGRAWWGAAPPPPPPHPPLNCREKKNRRERQKGKISNKKPWHQKERKLEESWHQSWKVLFYPF